MHCFGFEWSQQEETAKHYLSHVATFQKEMCLFFMIITKYLRCRWLRRRRRSVWPDVEYKNSKIVLKVAKNVATTVNT